MLSTTSSSTWARNLTREPRQLYSITKFCVGKEQSQQPILTLKYRLWFSIIRELEDWYWVVLEYSLKYLPLVEPSLLPYHHSRAQPKTLPDCWTQLVALPMQETQPVTPPDCGVWPVTSSNEKDGTVTLEMTVICSAIQMQGIFGGISWSKNIVSNLAPKQFVVLPNYETQLVVPNNNRA